MQRVPSPLLPPERLRRSRRASRGFTLIELTVALLAGLIVALGVMGLSRDATHTFHEEMRSSAAEAALRTAVDRLRTDLLRAGFMSTGNILLDQHIATAPGAANTANILVGASVVQNGLGRLASVYRAAGGSVTNNGIALSTTNGLNPDLLQVSGNLTSSDRFSIAPGIDLSPTGTCTRIHLDPTSPAMYRVLAAGTTAAPQALHDIFQPEPNADTDQFIVRLVDNTDCAQYLVTCATSVSGSGGAAGFDAAGAPYLDIDTNTTALVRSTGGKGCGITGYCLGCWVNPVITAQWEITSATGTPGDPEPGQDQAIAGQPLAPTTPDPNKYDLMRTYYNAYGAPIPDTSEIIAEYAVDLDFAFSVETSLSASTSSIVTYGFEDANNVSWSNSVITLGGTAATTGPQRIRSVRARIATRAAQPDRSLNIAVGNYGSQTFMYRYKIDATNWARARTVVTQVALPNQARNFY